MSKLHIKSYLTYTEENNSVPNLKDFKKLIP